jgi:phthalate 4,5-dioxygenase
VDQKLRTFPGIRGISEQDACIQDSQGFIADRTREHLGPTDAAIAQFRRLMLRAARDLRAGVEPPAARNGAAYAVRSGSALADRSVAFADVMRERFGDGVGWVGPRPSAPTGAPAPT